jgi:hypothetical protein
MTDVNQDHVEGFSTKQEFTSTHIQTINISDTLDHTHVTLCPKVPLSAAVNVYCAS